MMARRPTGIINAAPIPCKTRAAINIGTLREIPQINEDRVKMRTAYLNTRLVPKRSAIHPLTGIKRARLRRELVTTAFKLKGRTFKSAAMVGTAVLTIVESSCSINTAAATTQGR
jgi:hypothetical protein